MIEVIIPTRLPAFKLDLLVRQIEETAGYPHHIIHTGDPLGSAAQNRNLGLDQARGEVVVMVDDDVEFPGGVVYNGWLKVFADALSRPEVIMASAQLLKPGGSYAYMTGLDDCRLKPRFAGETVVPTKKLLTACCAFKFNTDELAGLRFDEGFVGSGFEDIDFCNQLALVRPDGLFLVCHEARAVHRNEAKEQRGDNWTRNKAYYNSKWSKQCLS